MRLYLRVTEDKYELPIAVAESQKELAEMLGISKNGVEKMYYYARQGKGRGKMYKVVEIDDADFYDDVYGCDSCSADNLLCPVCHRKRSRRKSGKNV